METAIHPNRTQDQGTYKGRLHELDYGSHIHLLEEWNDSSTFEWDAGYEYDGPEDDELTILHPFRVDGLSAVAEAVYLREGEGDLTELVVHDHRGHHVLTRVSAELPSNEKELARNRRILDGLRRNELGDLMCPRCGGYVTSWADDGESDTADHGECESKDCSWSTDEVELPDGEALDMIADILSRSGGELEMDLSDIYEILDQTGRRPERIYEEATDDAADIFDGRATGFLRTPRTTDEEIDWLLCQVQFTARVESASAWEELLRLGLAQVDQLQPSRLALTAEGLRRFQAIPREGRVAAGQELRGEGS